MPRRSHSRGTRDDGWSFDSAIYGGAWATPEMGALFADIPRTRRWLDLLALLAEVQAEHGLNPTEAAQDIRATCGSIEVNADFLGECREGYETTSHSTSGLIAAVARRCAGSGGEWFYFGATVQDLTDTWLMLTLREARCILIADLDRAIKATEDLCPAPSGYGHGRANSRPAGFADHFRLQGRRLARRTAAAQPPFRRDRSADGRRPALRRSRQPLGHRNSRRWQYKRFLERLGLREPDMSWTASRDILAEWAHLLVLTTGTADRIGHEVYNLQRDEIGELRERSHRERRQHHHAA